MPEGNSNSAKLIFLTDNDEDDLMLLHEALLTLDQPIEIVEVGSGEQLIDRLSKMTERFPDFIFLDIAMPGTDGFQCIELIRNMIETPSEIKIIIYSSDSSPWTMEKAFSLGADFYAVKPSRYQDLKICVESVIGTDWRTLEKSGRIFHAS